MACIGEQNLEHLQYPQFPDVISPSFTRARRPALIPPTSSLSLAEADELVRTRIHQPLFPPPDPLLLENIRPASPANSTKTASRVAEARRSRENSPTSNYNHSADTPAIPPALARDPRRRNAWLKARAQYARDRELRRVVTDPNMESSPEPEAITKNAPADFGPKRKRSAFVKEQELKCLIEDRVGTPHISELQADDDVSAQLNVEELKVGGEVAALDTAGIPLKQLGTDGVTPIPEEIEKRN
ncbi:hypothetical protein BU26DRAFT_332241 [Trematosphaeria pertusa]|uniref:Uncharacterized protein n=1 Tax=Trematosphaeria pertusa TaxID=390896 RepID=A0A6A6ID99_9PLEO|nr:uncharacterized protein BU26DRAFT_332241 [Trematosphaeria pertusa]KAF2248371.1 hypothetical protein BU26DRAFT_332241 [Trematosphaeria pertusa]